MGQAAIVVPSYVIKAGELTALNYLGANHARPQSTEWINRGTDQKLRRTTVDHLLRTFFQESVSPSIAHLRETTGLRLNFRSERDRGQFAAAFQGALTREASREQSLAVALFDNRQAAQRAIEELAHSGIPQRAIVLSWRAGRFMDTNRPWPEGHSLIDVVKAVAGGGIASALLAAGVVAIPGIGGVAAAGAVAAASGSIGAAGAAIAKMLSDTDVDDVGARIFEQEFGGKVFVSVDLQIAAGREDLARDILRRSGGTIDMRGAGGAVTLAA